MKFFYNERGQRIKKESYNTTTFALQNTTFYELDLSGNAMAIYNQPNGGTITQLDLPIYGLSRLGVYNKATAISSYEITDHLGNVRAVVEKQSGSPVIKSFADYYPFGELLPNRNSLNYRYASQGQELDGETGMEAFQLRLWDGRIGRWLSPDPMGQYASPYLGMGSNPISSIDPDGGFANPVFGSDGSYRGNTIEGFTGVPLIYDGNADFSKMEAGGLLTLGGRYFNFQLTPSAQANMMNNILQGTNYFVNPFYDNLLGETYSYGSFFTPAKFQTSELRGGSMSVNLGERGTYNNPANSIGANFTNSRSPSDGSYSITSYGFLSYEPTVENIRATVIVHEGLVHGKWGFIDENSLHRIAYLATINSNLYNNTTPNYKKHTIDGYSFYARKESNSYLNEVIIGGKK